MIYIVGTKRIKDGLIFVKASSQEEVLQQLKLLEGESIVSQLTDNEMHILNLASFAVIRVK